MLSSLLRLIAIVACLVAACSKEHDRPGSCLPLPAAPRTELMADPKGTALYWYEPVRSYDFDSNLSAHYELVRFDLGTRQQTVLADHAQTPLLFIGGKLLFRRYVTTGTLVLLDPSSGKSQIVSPSYLDVTDVELVDHDTIAVLAAGDGPPAVYTIDLDRPRPHHLIDADRLLSVSGGRVFVVANDAGMAVDIHSGRLETFPTVVGAMPQRADLVHVADRMVKVRTIPTANDRTVVADKRTWKLVHQADSILARSPQEHDHSYAYLITNGAAEALPVIRGGTSILGTTKIGKRVWALIGHNVANFAGDLGDTVAEADVCSLPKANTATFQGRSAPKRYARKFDLLYAVLNKKYPKAGIQIFDDYGEPTTVYIELKEPSGMDLARMRAQATDLHYRVTSLLGEREVKTEVQFTDGTVSIFRWRRSRLAGHAWAGMGDATTADPAEFDVEIRDLVNEKTDAKVSCTGTLVNPKPTVLRGVEVRCLMNDRSNTIHIPEILPNASHAFSHTFDVDENERPFFELMRGREPLDVRDTASEELRRQVFELGKAVYAETELALMSHKVRDGFRVDLRSRAEFTSKTPEARTSAAARAHEMFEKGLRSIYKIADDSVMELGVVAQISQTAYEFADGKLTP